MMRILRTLIILFGKLVYGRKYISGRYFTPVAIGARWILEGILYQRILGYNKNVLWPVSNKVMISNPENIDFDVDDMHIFHTSGTYFQATDARISIGKGTWIAPNVGIITTNHDLHDPEAHVGGKAIVLGEKCWIGMNSVILPGVELGDHTVVGAGSIVTKSFKEGHCVICGVPARVVKFL